MRKFVFAVLLMTGFCQAWAVSCGDVLTTNVTLTSDLHCTTGFYALEAGANGITIDLNGHTLSGTSALAGIIATHVDGVTIRGPGLVRGFWAGVNSAETRHLTVKDMVFYKVGTGVIVSAGSNAQVSGNQFITTGSIAVQLRAHSAASIPTEENWVFNNEMYDVLMGIEVCGISARYNLIEENLIWKPRIYGLHLFDLANDNMMSNNDIYEAGEAAVNLANANNNKMYGGRLETAPVGISLNTQPFGSCEVPPGSVPGTMYNEFNGLHVFDFNIGVLMGGGAMTGLVAKNRVNNNKIYYDNTGMDFRSNTYANDGTGNAYLGTTTPVVDAGTANVY